MHQLQFLSWLSWILPRHPVHFLMHAEARNQVPPRLYKITEGRVDKVRDVQVMNSEHAFPPKLDLTQLVQSRVSTEAPNVYPKSFIFRGIQQHHSLEMKTHAALSVSQASTPNFPLLGFKNLLPDEALPYHPASKKAVTDKGRKDTSTICLEDNTMLFSQKYCSLKTKCSCICWLKCIVCNP